MTQGWIGVDLDGTLAVYDGWKGIDHIGVPIMRMANRVKQWLEEGKDIRIFTARVHPNQDGRKLEQARYWIEVWCMNFLGRKLPVTCEKDFAMVELWDDRCIQIETNTGRRADGKDWNEQ